MLLLKIAMYVLLIYGGLCLVLFFMQAKIIFPASRQVDRNPGHYGWDFEELLLDVDGEFTHGWFVPLENARGTVLFSHGNAGSLTDRLESIALLRSLGFSVLAYDYGGYGRSTGNPSEKRTRSDARAMWQYLTEERGIPDERILLFGRSLGAAVTVDLAGEVKSAAVVMESAFLSIRDMAKDTLPWLPVGWLLRHNFANKDKVAHISSPLLVIHSPDDEIIPYRHGRELFERAAEPKQFIEICGRHNEGFMLCVDIYRKGLEDFLAPLLPREDTTFES